MKLCSCKPHWVPSYIKTAYMVTILWIYKCCPPAPPPPPDGIIPQGSSCHSHTPYRHTPKFASCTCLHSSPIQTYISLYQLYLSSGICLYRHTPYCQLYVSSIILHTDILHSTSCMSSVILHTDIHHTLPAVSVLAHPHTYIYPTLPAVSVLTHPHTDIYPTLPAVYVLTHPHTDIHYTLPAASILSPSIQTYTPMYQLYLTSLIPHTDIHPILPAVSVLNHLPYRHTPHSASCTGLHHSRLP